jgi:protein-L-isoaspartate(D-aspartate) O-methyltransferase
VTGPDAGGLPVELRHRMVDAVLAHDFVAGWRAGVVPWRPALMAVPRHEFLPDTVWVENDDGGPPAFVPLHREQDPDRWLRLAYAADDGVATQVDDGRPTGPGVGGSLPSSSASAPVIVAVMLAALDAHEGHRVLEVGTGTGYNAALLAYWLGAGQVTSIEIDPDIATHARKALSKAGFGAVRVVTGEGALGYPPGAPYDRVIVTAACHQIPYAWVAQTRPGGRIVLPWANTYTGGLVVLTVAEDCTARGRIVTESNFMWLREQRGTRGAVKPTMSNGVGDPECAEERVTTLHPSHVTRPHGARVAIGQRVPGCQWRYWPWEPDDPVGVLWLVDPWGSRAKLTHTSPNADEDEFPVLQSGPRRLWDEVEAACRWWLAAGSPGADRWHFTVTPEGQRVELLPEPSGRVG